MASSIQLKRGTAAALHASNPVLLRGEPALEIDTNKIKYGDGVTPWRDLPYGNPAIEVVDGGESTAGAVPAVPGTFSPPTIEGLVLWLDGGNTDYTHVVKNRVSMWEDMSESDAKFVQSNRLNRPLATNQLSGRGVVTFDGENDALVGNLQLPGEFTLLVALRRRGTSTNGKIFAAYTADNSTELVLCGTETGSSVGVRFEEEYSATQPLDDLVPVVYTLQFGTDGLSTRLNGLSTQAAEGITVPVLTHMSIGGSRANFTEDNYSGDVAEVVLYEGVLSAADLVDAENYMMNRWGIIQVAHPLMDGMKAFWRLNEESGNRLDITEDEIPLTPTGAVGFAEGVIENAAELTGGNNYLQAPGDFALEGSFSISLWFKPEGVSGGSSSLVQNWAAGNASGQVLLGFGDEGEDSGVLFGRISTDDDTYTVSGGDLEDGLWHHVVLAYDTNENTLTLYHDAEQVSQIYTAGSFNAGNIPLRVGIGDQIASQNDFPFLADQLGFWDRALTLAEVQMLYNYELGKEDFTADVYGDNVSLLLHMDKPANASGGGGGGGGGDPYFNNVSLLLHMDGSNGSTTFTDSSANALTATVNGNAVISTAQSKFGGASGYFDGSADLAFVPSEETHFGVADFTIEFWLYATSSPQDNQVVVSLCLWPNTSGIVVHYTNDYIAAFTGGFAAYHAVPRGADNAWHHYAVVRTNGQIAIYVDGVLGTPTPSSFGTFDQAFTDGIQYIGRPSDVDSYKLHGYIDDLRITKGVARYTANFTPPTAPFPDSAGTSTDPNFNNVSLLLHMDGSNGSTTFTDSSPDAMTVTASGDAQISTAQSKFGGASGYFDGIDSYLEVASSDGLSLGAGDFTVEMWLRADSAPAYIVCSGVGPSGNPAAPSTSGWNVRIFSGDLQMERFDGVNESIISFGAWSPPSGTWVHLAISRASGVSRAFADGMLIGESADETAWDRVDAGETLWIGHAVDGNGPSFLQGYIDELRIIKGAAVYTSNFTPPTAPFPDPTPPPPALLLHFDGLDGSTSFVDSSPNNLNFTSHGNAVISTAQSKFGGSSGYFDGNGDYLSTSSALAIGTSDFTVECWIYISSGASGYRRILSQQSPNQPPDIIFRVEATGEIAFYGPSTTVTGATVVSDGQWHHIAAVRSGGALKIYVDGIEDASASFSDNIGNSQDLRIGAFVDGSESWNGYIDEFRIVKGTAVYTSNFTPPTAAFPNPPVVPRLLLHFDGSNGSTTFTDSSPNALTVTAEGDAQISTAQSKFGGASGYFDGNGDYVEAMETGDEFTFASGDFTVEFWMKDDGTTEGGFRSVISQSPTTDSGLWFGRFDNGAVTVLLGSGSSWFVNQTCPTNVFDGNWNHIAIVRGGSTLKVYVNGAEDASASATGSAGNGTGKFTVGGSPNYAQWYKGWVDDLRVVKGAALYTANFTPPTAPFPDAAGGGGSGPISTFIDTSKHNHELTAVGNAYLNLEDLKYGNASGEFAGGHCEIAMSPEFAFDDGDFTVEFWGKLNYAANSAVFSTASSTQEAGTYLIGFGSDPNMFGFCYDIENLTFASANIAVHYDEWAHYAFVRLDGTLKMYVDGYEVATANTNINLDGGAQTTAVIGRRWTDEDDYYLDGLIDDLRITKGVARYISNFNPPTKAFPDPVIPATAPSSGDPYAEDVVLLLHMDGTDGSTNFVDNSYLQNTVTAEGNAVISTTQSKFGGASGYFDGSEDYLSIPASSQFDFGTGDFTIEGWVRLTSGSTSSGEVCLISGGGGFPDGWGLFISANSGGMDFAADTGGGWTGAMLYGSKPSTETWHHIALVRNSGTVTLYLDGIAGASSGSFSGTLSSGAAGVIVAGHDQSPPANLLSGYIDDLRITKGVARYTNNFTPPTAPFPSPFTPSPAATLLMHFDGSFDDVGKNGLSFTAAGGASVSTDQSKFGGSSAYFDGISGTSLSAPSSSDFAFDGDFTVEAWIYRTGNGTVFGGTAFAQIATALGNGDATGWTLFIANGTDLNFLGSTGGGWQVVVVGPATIPLYQWCHVAVTRSGQDIRIFLDGTETVTGTSSASIVGGTNLYVGSYPLINGYGQASFQGYIDELRIIKGAAVYTSNFTPPAEPFKATSEVTPTDVPGCDLWLDSTADILLNNGSITNWPDKSGKTRPATPADYAPAPTLAVGEGPLGQNVVRFTGDPNVLDVGHEFKLKNSSGFVLARHASDITGSPYGRFLSFQPANGFDYDQADGLSLSTNTNNPTGVGLYNNGLDVTHAMTHPIGWTLLSYTIDSSGLAKLRIDGTEVGSETFAGIANAAGGNLYIGHGGGLGFIEALKGDIAEIVLFDHALGEAALVALERGVISRCLPPPDPTVLLLHFDGANGSTTFTDSSANGFTMTTFGTPQISTTESKFGGASGYFDGGDLVLGPDSSQVAFGTGDFIVEAWLYVNDPTAYGAVFSSRNSGQTNDANAVFLALLDDGSPIIHTDVLDLTATTAVADNTWTHVAWTRKNGTARIYVDGVESGSVSFTKDLTGENITIGGEANTGQVKFTGYIDELRIVKGTGIDANFTPPTEPFI